jgi:small GTP-binding protein
MSGLFFHKARRFLLSLTRSPRISMKKNQQGNEAMSSQYLLNSDPPLKVLIVGPAGCGKTSMQRVFAGNKGTVYPTVGVDFAVKTVMLNDGRIRSMHIWDIGGQDRTNRLTRAYTAGATAALIVCDITAPETIDAALAWRKQLLDSPFHCDRKECPVKCILVFNKADLPHSVVSDEHLDDIAKENGLEGWLRTSAVGKGFGIDAAFHKAAELAAELMDLAQPAAGGSFGLYGSSPSFSLTDQGPTPRLKEPEQKCKC